MGHRVLSHTADTGVEATARSLDGLIAELATGMFELMARVEPDSVDRWIEIEVSAETLPDLVVDALSELLYRCEVEDVVFGAFRVRATVDPPAVHMAAGGVDVAGAVAVGPVIKAVTYHGLVVEHRGDGWHGTVYFDV
jgi:SHS2 domain-containing protein